MMKPLPEVNPAVLELGTGAPYRPGNLVDSVRTESTGLELSVWTHLGRKNDGGSCRCISYVAGKISNLLPKLKESCVTNVFRNLIARTIIPLVTIVALATLSPSTSVMAQNPSGTISGSVRDSGGAMIQHASVELKNADTGDIRNVSTNEAGMFTFPALPSGNYEILVNAPGFARFTETGYHLDPGDSRSLNNIVLAVKAAKNEDVVVVADSERIDTTSGETSALITSGDIEHLAVEGRDVTELFKILPGFAIANQGVGNTAYDPSQVSCCPGGAISSYVANGTPVAGVAMKWDGGNITDPGAYTGTLQNVNYDMVSEVKTQVGSFTAEESNGPVVVNAVTRAGSQQFHGSVYTYARTSQLNSTDWLASDLGYQKPTDRYVYPGISIGGPLVIPGTKFNQNKKVTFFAGIEDYAQRDNYAYGAASNAIIHALVPTANMRAGNFSSTEIANYLGSSYGTGGFANLQTTPTVDKNGNPVSNGNIANTIDPGAKIMFGLLPLPNMPSNGSYNYLSQNLIDNDMWQLVTRGDVAISDKMKLFARYSTEQGLTGVPQIPYYSPSAVMGGVDTPGGGVISTINSQSAAANLLMILSATTTNEVFGSLTYLDYAFKAKNMSALTAKTYNYPYSGLYSTNGSVELPMMQDYGYDGMPLMLLPDFSYGPLFSKKFLPDAGDNFTKLLGKHELRAGVYVEQVTSNQRQINPSNSTNGALASYWYGSQIQDLDGSTYSTSGNYLANEMQGLFMSYTQQNLTPNMDLFFWNVDGYVTDSWKVRKTLALNFGLRVEHLGTWDNRHGTGIAIFDPITLSETASNFVPLPGFRWHAMDSTVPTSGVTSKPAFVEPRAGFSWDVSGKGKTVLRGGYGQYRYHDSWNDVSPAAMSGAGVRSTDISGNGGVSLKAVSEQNLPITGGGLNLSEYGLDPTDNKTAITQTYTLAVDRALPYKTQLEVAYIGNHTTNLFDTGTQVGSSLSNVNALPYGALFAPVNGVIPTPFQIGSMSTNQLNSYRKYGTNPYDPTTGQLTTSPYGSVNNYGVISIPEHNAYSNYNGIQFVLQRQSGPFRYGTNYTFGKALGVLGAVGGGNTIDATNVRANYGVAPFDRTHVFNANYAYTFGKLVQGKLLGGAVNGWEISGITGIQSGQNLQVATGGSNFGAEITVTDPSYTGGSGLSTTPTNGMLLGTTDITVMPTLKCDPRSARSHGQFINGNCFAIGGQTSTGAITNGPDFYPYMHGPVYFNSDLTLQKALHLTESKQLQLRLAGFNFLNHPLTSFNGARSNEYTLNFVGATPGTAAPQPLLDSPATGSEFGTATLKQGRRVMEVSAKFVF